MPAHVTSPIAVIEKVREGERCHTLGVSPP